MAKKTPAPPKKKAASKKPRTDNSIQATAEPQGGPWGRLTRLVDERSITPHPKEEDDAPAPAPAPAPARRSNRESVDSTVDTKIPRQRQEPPLPPDFRKERIRQYRERQKDKFEETRGSALPNIESVEPMPPVPAPANNWISIGPSVVRKGQTSNQAAVCGRVAGIAVNNGASVVYAAAANGGVWRSDDAGQSWRSLMEAWDLNPTAIASDSLACGAIAISPVDANRVYVGTGEGSSAYSGGGPINGVGPIRSDDGGVNWIPEPSTPDLAGSSFYELAVDAGDPQRVVAATHTGLYRRQPAAGGGFEWVRKLSGVFSSVVAARSGTTTTFYAAERGGTVRRSNDGHTWTATGSGFPAADLDRIALGIRSNDPDLVYALICRGDPTYLMKGVWRLDGGTGSGGGTWRQVSGHPADLFGTGAQGQGWYDLAIAVDPNNANRIYVGGSTRSSGVGGADQWSAALYRSTVASSGSGSSLAYSMTNTAIGASVHADVHALVVTPGHPDNLWVGCDGGVFSCDDASTGATFTARNTGLAIVTCEHLALHPTEGSVAFIGAQDEGTVRYTGEEAWLYMAPGDGGFPVINWADPYRVLVTYPSTVVRRYTDGGQRYTYSDVSLSSGDPALFYAPMVGTPRNAASPAQAERVAIGTTRPWISETFGGGWASIPANTTADRLGTTNGFRIRSMAFTTYNRLFVGTMNGRVYRYDRSGAAWTSTRIDTAAGLPATFSVPVTDIAPDLADATGASIYITFGGALGDYRRIWHYDGSSWQQRSGPAAASLNSVIDVQFNAVIVDPANTNHVYAGADIGAWRSTDGGANWSTFSEGLPDAFVEDLKTVQLATGLTLIRASTHGRGVYERTLDSVAKLPVELYIRDTQLDEGRFPTVNWLPDPTQPGEQVRHWAGPDIRVDTPNSMGQYQFPLGSSIDFFEYDDQLTDDAGQVATHVTANIVTRVYVQVHNRGTVPANSVRVMCLLANASAGLPALPAGYDNNVRNAIPIATPDWQTLGFATIDDIRPGSPKIAAFDLPSTFLPPPAALAGHEHHCVLALVHHASDPYTSTITNTDDNSLQERKAAHKNLHVVEFTGTVPTAPMVIPVRFNNPYEKVMSARFTFAMNGYPARVRVFSPALTVDGGIAKALRGFKRGEDNKDFAAWAAKHIDFVEKSQRSKRPFNRVWSSQRVEDLKAALDSKIVLVADPKMAEVRKVKIPPRSRYTVFLVVDRPARAKIGQSFKWEVRQYEEPDRLIGGLAGRVDMVAEARQPLPVVAKAPTSVKPKPNGTAKTKAAGA